MIAFVFDPAIGDATVIIVWAVLLLTVTITLAIITRAEKR